MKRLFAYVILPAICSALTATATNKWNDWRQPQPIRPAAAALIASLEQGDGWEVGPAFSRPFLPDSCSVSKTKKGRMKKVVEDGCTTYRQDKDDTTTVVIGCWSATVKRNGLECDEAFNNSELRAINDSAASCRQKLISRAFAGPALAE